nr:MAG TPA: hypothetical protein [Caudoviricetes sp.]
MSTPFFFVQHYQKNKRKFSLIFFVQNYHLTFWAGRVRMTRPVFPLYHSPSILSREKSHKLV